MSDKNHPLQIAAKFKSVYKLQNWQPYTNPKGGGPNGLICQYTPEFGTSYEKSNELWDELGIYPLSPFNDEIPTPDDNWWVISTFIGINCLLQEADNV